jgi:monoamine oxidase
MSLRTSRRRFLKDTALAVATLSTRPTLPPGLLRVQARSAESVIVVGGGPAGLAAAHRLRAAGQRVTVLEARKTAGGRVHTVRAPFNDGLYGEAGAARISEAHTLTLGWANELGLPVIPFGSTAGASLAVIQGKRYRSDDDESLRGAKLDLKPEERGLAPSALLKRYIGDSLADLGEPDPDAAAYARWQAYDRQTWPEWLHARGASEDAVALMTLGGDPKALSALYVLRQIALHGGARRYYTIRGGMDLLPRALATALGDSIKYNVAVAAIEQGPANVQVSTVENGRNGTLIADRLVLAIPFSTLRRIDIRTPFARDKMRAIETLSYYPATRFLFQTRNRFWQESGLSGAARTDFAVETWDMSAGQSGTRGILSTTAGGRMDEALVPLDPTARGRAGRKMLSQAFPDADPAIDISVTRRWSEDPWARGAFAAFAPGQMTTLMPAIARAEGRVHFAGEHTSPWTGWMEGALRSAARVAEEILLQ